VTDYSRQRPLLLTLLCTAASCSIPTDTPTWDTEWTASAGTIAVTAADVLPDDVSEDGQSFTVPVFPSTTTFMLSEFCAGCEAGGGPKPPFEQTVAWEPATPVDVVGGVVVGGELRVRLRHGWGFDPLRPGGPETGSLTVELVDLGGTSFGSASLDGGSSEFPSGADRDLVISLEPGELEGGGVLLVDLSSPAGADATLDPTAELSVSVLTGSSIRAGAVDIRIGDGDVESTALQFDLTDVDDEVEGHVERGALVLTTGNTLDLAIGGALDLRPGQGAVITKALAVPKENAVQRFELSQEEIRSILGQLVDVRARGRVIAGQDGTVRVEPADRLDLKLDLELTVRVGS
jgi:hypothetical protein